MERLAPSPRRSIHLCFAFVCASTFLLSGCATSSHDPRTASGFSVIPAENPTKENKPVESSTPALYPSNPPIWSKEYDTLLYSKISEKWWALLDKELFPTNEHGVVLVHFVLTSDGQVKDFLISKSQVSKPLTLVCQKAILESAPFPEWPAEMRQKMGKDTRLIQFHFTYY